MPAAPAPITATLLRWTGFDLAIVSIARRDREVYRKLDTKRSQQRTTDAGQLGLGRLAIVRVTDKLAIEAGR